MKPRNSYLYVVLTITILFAFSLGAYAQKESDLDKLYWNGKTKITLDDFGIQTKDASQGLSSAAFSLEYNIHALSFFGDFNKKVRHCMIRSASQITLDGNVDQYIRYQQTLFDIQEIYVRLLRKALKENKSKLFLRTALADELREQIIGVDLPVRQAKYNNETNSGKDELKQKEWEQQIKKELLGLNDYAYK